MKKFLKILLILFLIIILGVAAAFYFTAGLPKAADQFFSAVKDKQMDQAYSLVSEDFKSGTSKEQLQQFLQASSLNNYASASWDSRSINGGRGTLKGIVTSVEGFKVPLEMSFVKTDSGWKIHSIRKPTSGVSETTQTLKVPDEAELVALVNDSMGAFGGAVKARSMVTLHDQISSVWQKQVTVEQLDQAFGTFYGNPFDFSSLEGLKPAFTGEPMINGDGVLNVSGFYPTAQYRLVFELKYFKEGLSWKLLGINVQVK